MKSDTVKDKETCRKVFVCVLMNYIQEKVDAREGDKSMKKRNWIRLFAQISESR